MPRKGRKPYRPVRVAPEVPGRSGPMTDEDRAFIKGNAGKMTASEIAAHIQKRPETVRKYMLLHGLETVPGGPPTKLERRKAEKDALRRELRDSKSWKKLAEEFTEPELAYFEEEWVGLVAQFRDDVLKTEEQQIRKAITMDILMRRNLVMRKRALADIERLEGVQRQALKDLEAERASLDGPQRRKREDYLLALEGQINSARRAEQDKTREYTDLEKQHQKLMIDLKATRDQRISKIEEGRQTFLGIIKELEDEDRRAVASRQLALASRATALEYARLAGPHVYADGNEDLPVLSAETVAMLDAPAGRPGEGVQP